MISTSPEQTEEWAAELAKKLSTGDTILLNGQLGAGKTCLARGLGRGLGITEPITSPSFTLINEYWHGRIPLFHIDLYRLEGEMELASLGLEEYFGRKGLTCVEWGERLGDWVPPESVNINIDLLDNGSRSIEIINDCRRARELII
jgi:tRNA threonylcarbamoyladenosine biosynthesis protein TsaE